MISEQLPWAVGHSTDTLWVSPSFGYDGDLMYYKEPMISLGRSPARVRLAVETNSSIESADLRVARILCFTRGSKSKTAPGVGSDYARPSRRFPTPGTWLRLLRRSERTFVIQEFSPVCLAAALVALVRRKSLVVLVEGHPRFRGGGEESAIAVRLKSAVCHLARRVVCASPLAADYVRNSLKVAGDKIVVAPYVTSDFSHRVGVKSRDKGGHRNLLFVNSLTERKGLRLLLEALKGLDGAMQRQISLDVVGGGPLAEELEDLAGGLPSHVRFWGRVPYSELHALFEKTDVVVAPSMMDYRSLVCFEAVTAGRLLIASIFDGASQECVQDGVNGFVIDPTSETDWGSVLRRVCTMSNASLVRMCRESRRIGLPYTIPVVTQEVSKALMDV